MLSISPTDRSPKVIIHFPELLFEVSGRSVLADPEAFYAPVIQYVADNFYEIQHSTSHRGSPSLTLHFYLSETGAGDLGMLRRLDARLFEIQEFRTFVYWYVNPHKPAAVACANEVQQTFQNPVRLIENSVHV